MFRVALATAVAGILAYVMVGQLKHSQEQVSQRTETEQLYATVDSLLEDAYTAASHDLEAIPYFEFTHHCIFPFLNRCAAINDSLRATITRSETVGVYDGYWSTQVNAWYSKLVSESKLKPNFKNVLEESSRELEHCQRLMIEDLPYEPYKP